MIIGRHFFHAAVLTSFSLSVPSAAQDQSAIHFAGAVYDVTGAGRLDLDDINAVLQPFVRNFRDGAEQLGVEVTVDRNGAVVACRSEGSSKVTAAGNALCAHALAEGRFEQFPKLVLDYTHASYTVSVRTRRVKPDWDVSPFDETTAYPPKGVAVRFDGFVVPPEDQRLNRSDIKANAMDFPTSALRNEIEAQVVVALTFDGEGMVATCRPVYSSNTARMAYETCRAAQRAYRRISPPDARPYVWSTVWQIESSAP